MTNNIFGRIWRREPAAIIAFAGALALAALEAMVGEWTWQTLLRAVLVQLVGIAIRGRVYAPATIEAKASEESQEALDTEPETDEVNP